MAIWQFRLTLLPEAVVQQQCGEIPERLAEELAEDFPWWAATQPPKNFEDLIGRILPERASWSTSMRMWGSEDGDDATVCYTDEEKIMIEEIFFRLDAGTVSPELVREVSNIATKLECVFITADQEVLRADESKVFAALINSTARRFVEDPVNTLKEIGRSGKFGTAEIDSDLFS
jgi:hypothetical protein